MISVVAEPHIWTCKSLASEAAKILLLQSRTVPKFQAVSVDAVAKSGWNAVCCPHVIILLLSTALRIDALQMMQVAMTRDHLLIWEACLLKLPINVRRPDVIVLA